MAGVVRDGAAAGLDGGGDRRRAASEGVSPQAWAERGGGDVPPRTGPTGWWPRSTRGASWSGDCPPGRPDAAVPGGARDPVGKGVRAEPVAALYEQGRVAHRGEFRELEEQMRLMSVGGYQGEGSPDRVDALVWALTELIIEPASNKSQIRGVRRPLTAAAIASEERAEMALQFFRMPRKQPGGGQGLGGGAGDRLPGGGARGLVAARHRDADPDRASSATRWRFAA